MSTHPPVPRQPEFRRQRGVKNSTTTSMNSKKMLVSWFAALALATSAKADFHLMQIEQVIAGINGDISAQAIQLRMRFSGENLVHFARVRVWAAEGNKPVVLIYIPTDVSRFAAGSRVLLATPQFTAKMRRITPSFTPDFTLTNPIPETDLAAGRLTYESKLGDILWSFAWGGAAYTGSNGGASFNDANGNFGPPFPQSLPTAGRLGVLFKGPANALSTSNAEDYVLSANPPTVTTNNGISYIVGRAPEISVEEPVGTPLVDGTAKVKFGSADPGTTGKTLTFKIRNIGTAQLNSLAVTKTGSNAGDFHVTSLLKTTIGRGGSTEFKITFKPIDTGTRTAGIHIKSNDANESSFDIKLTGTGSVY